MKRTFQLGATGLMWLLCFHAAASSNQPPFTADVPIINQDFSRGGSLFVMLRLEGGEELPFFVDTGASDTFLDKSLAPKLGNCLGTRTIWLRRAKETADVYAAPRLHAGNMPLMTGRHICTVDLRLLSQQTSQPVMGILGMDCLSHYCIQLDFEAGRMRFWTTNLTDHSELGKAVPLTGTLLSDVCFIRYGSLMGEKGSKTMLDTGCNVDGILEPGLYQRAIRENHIVLAEDGVIKDSPPVLAGFPKCVWNGETYTNLFIRECENSWLQRKEMGGNGNALGLRFLARHLVTLDFPQKTMYLKQTSIGPFSNNENNN